MSRTPQKRLLGGDVEIRRVLSLCIFRMASAAKKSRSERIDPSSVLDMVLEGSDHEGMSSDEESDIDRQIAGYSEESR